MRIYGNMQLDRRVAWAVKIGLSVLIIVLLFKAIGLQEFRLAFSQANWRWMVSVYAVAFFIILVNAALLKFLLASARLVVSLSRVLLAKALGSFYSLVLPGDLFGGIAKWANLSAATGDRPGVLTAIVLAKIALAVPPLAIGSVAFVASNPLPVDYLGIIVAATAIVVISATALLLHPVTGRHLGNALFAVLRRGPAFVQLPVERFISGMAGFRRLRAMEYGMALGLSLANYALAIAGMYFATRAAGVAVPITALFWINLILFITRLLPLTVGNLGIREGVLVLAFGLYGVPGASAVLVGLLMFSSVLLVGVLGGVYQLAIANGWVAWRIGEDAR